MMPGCSLPVLLLAPLPSRTVHDRIIPVVKPSQLYDAQHIGWDSGTGNPGTVLSLLIGSQPLSTSTPANLLLNDNEAASANAPPCSIANIIGTHSAANLSEAANHHTARSACFELFDRLRHSLDLESISALGKSLHGVLNQ